MPRRGLEKSFDVAVLAQMDPGGAESDFGLQGLIGTSFLCNVK